MEQRLYTRPMPGGVNLEATIAFLMVDGTIEVLRIDPVTGKATRTTPWTPSDEWEIKSIIDLSSGDVLDPKTRSVVGRAIGGRCGVKPNVERTRADAKRK